MSRHAARASLLVTLVLCVAPLSTGAQQQAAACAGQIVSKVEIRTAPPPFAGVARRWQAVARTVRLHHATTQDDVVAAFLSLGPGQACVDFRRAESERVLRAQPFLADATVRVEPDTGGTVMLVVTTTDEVPVLLGARFHGVAPQSLTLGNENIAGEAIRVDLRAERGGAYRNGFGGHFENDALLGHPYRLTLDGDRLQVGQQFRAEIEHPIFTDLQRISWHAGVITRDTYLPFERSSREPLVLQAHDQSWDVSGLLRLFGTHTVALLGGAVTGRRFDPATAGLVMDDTGFRADTGKALRDRYASFRATRVGITGGLRRVSFRTVNGFDALVGSQDVPYGATLGIFAAHGLGRAGESDSFVSSVLYAGAAWSRMWLATLAQVEGRRDPVTNAWDSVIGSARSALYVGSAPGIVMILSDELSGGSDSRLPLQLTFRDPVGGVLGYRNSGLAGARRNVVRGEFRMSGASVLHNADVGLATFGEIGTLWAGDAPYGVNATRASVGVSLLAGYPSHSKRMYRADVGIPLTRGGNARGAVEVRFSSADRTQGFWTEPADVARARTGTEPSRLFAWPTR
ncbi:MAG: hypothetical protein ABJE47_09855 [bacterium]